MTPGRYSLPAIVLHWLLAALILWLLWRGLTMVDMPKGVPRTEAYTLHKSVGLLALLLILLRLGWRRLNPGPALLGSQREVKLAGMAHRLLYLLMFLVPLTGYLGSSFSTYPLKFFGILVPKMGWPDEAIQGVFRELHEGAAWGLLVVAGFHIAAALWHGLRRDGTFSRMLPGADA